MSLETDEVLDPLYEVELQSFMSDFPAEMEPDARSHYEEVLVDSLTNIRNFISSYVAMAVLSKTSSTRTDLPLRGRVRKV